MIRWIKYRLALARAVAVSEAMENRNKLAIKKEEQEFSEYRASEMEKGKSIDDPGIFGRKNRKDQIIGALNRETLKAKRDIAEIHTMYLLREVNELGIPPPEPDEPDMWLKRGEDDDRELLSGVGIHNVRAAIRQERKERFDAWKDRAVLLFGAAGLVIALLTLTLRLLEVAFSRPVTAPSPSAADVTPQPNPAAVPSPE